MVPEPACTIISAISSGARAATIGMIQPAWLAPQSPICSAIDVIAVGEEPDAREHVARERGEVRLLPVARGAAGAALVVAQHGVSQPGEEPGPGAEDIAGERVRTVDQHERRVRRWTLRQSEGSRQPHRLVLEGHRQVARGEPDRDDRRLAGFHQPEPIGREVGGVARA